MCLDKEGVPMAQKGCDLVPVFAGWHTGFRSDDMVSLYLWCNELMMMMRID